MQTVTITKTTNEMYVVSTEQGVVALENVFELIAELEKDFGFKVAIQSQ